MSVSAFGLNLAKNVFQVHGADGAGQAVVRNKLRGDRLKRKRCADHTLTA